MCDNLERNNIQAGITRLLPTKGLLNKEMGAPRWLEARSGKWQTQPLNRCSVDRTVASGMDSQYASSTPTPKAPTFSGIDLSIYFLHTMGTNETALC